MELWFIVNDIYYALRISKGKELRELQENEKTFITTVSWYGDKYCKAINEKGLSRICSLKKKPEIKTFNIWMQDIVAPQLRQTGTYTPPIEEKTLYLLEN